MGAMSEQHKAAGRSFSLLHLTGGDECIKAFDRCNQHQGRCENFKLQSIGKGPRSKE